MRAKALLPQHVSLTDTKNRKILYIQTCIQRLAKGFPTMLTITNKLYFIELVEQNSKNVINSVTCQIVLFPEKSWCLMLMKAIWEAVSL